MGHLAFMQDGPFFFFYYSTNKYGLINNRIFLLLSGDG